SLLWPLKCSVRLAIRSVRIATCTSGEPVSPSARACSLMTSCLRSAVIDIVIPFVLEIEAPHDPDKALGSLHQRNGLFALHRQHQPRHTGVPRERPALFKVHGLFGSDGESRDV